MIKPDDLGGDADLARRVIAYARSIAPCLDSLVDGPGEDDPKPKADAIAILKAIASSGGARRPRHIKSESAGPARAEYFDSSWFSDDDRAALRALCSATSSPVGLPLGSFPKPSRVVAQMWPEDC